MGLFQEYLNSKGNVEKAKVNVTGDLVDPMTPPNAPKDGKPYGVSGTKPKKAEKGFGDEGDAKLKWQPKVDHSNGATPAKIPTAEQAELCGVVIDAIKKDYSLVEQMVSQFKRNGLLGALVAEMLQSKETYTHIAELMVHEEYGPSIRSKLDRALNEEVAPPFSDSLEGDVEDEEEDLEDEDEENVDPETADPLMGAAPQAQPPMPAIPPAMMGKR